MNKKKIKTIVFRPWNILVVIGFLGLAIGITKNKITIPELPGRYFHAGGIIFSLCGLAYFLRNLIRYLRSYGWNATRAIITASQVNEIDDSEGVQYQPQISYTYHVGVMEYSSTSIYPTGSWSSSFPSIALKTVSRYPAGKTVQVYYDPSRPEQAFLERKGLLFIIIGLFTFAITLAVFSLALAGFIQV
ncbi:MAG TPA: DUF3592 domain-containing protein [Spirochaetota bacterium]|nr:DUF3592 domain-containing protein [Spirochaetota bacterium]HQH99019.1 DUF3592 domain-containing protein [Spirochaetota bacterium]